MAGGTLAKCSVSSFSIYIYKKNSFLVSLVAQRRRVHNGRHVFFGKISVDLIKVSIGSVKFFGFCIK